mmetsp:Transcript_136571/g.424313  ORF Transcript_136571/g.424313 Transcript_136571/m.424313 type:complete len:306 (-) Transcript_136571:896-1813(-)
MLNPDIETPSNPMLPCRVVAMHRPHKTHRVLSESIVTTRPPIPQTPLRHPPLRSRSATSGIARQNHPQPLTRRAPQAAHLQGLARDAEAVLRLRHGSRRGCRPALPAHARQQLGGRQRRMRPPAQAPQRRRLRGRQGSRKPRRQWRRRRPRAQEPRQCAWPPRARRRCPRAGADGAGSFAAGLAAASTPGRRTRTSPPEVSRTAGSRLSPLSQSHQDPAPRPRCSAPRRTPSLGPRSSRPSPAAPRSQRMPPGAGCPRTPAARGQAAVRAASRPSSSEAAAPRARRLQETSASVAPSAVAQEPRQ